MRHLATDSDARELLLFVDFCSMPQRPRSEGEAKMFAQGLDRMGWLYASLTGTAVIQCKDLPSDPTLEKCVLCHANLEQVQRSRLVECKGYIGCEPAEDGRVRACFASQEQAEQAMAECRLLPDHFCLKPELNAIPYAQRGQGGDPSERQLCKAYLLTGKLALWLGCPAKPSRAQQSPAEPSRAYCQGLGELGT